MQNCKQKKEKNNKKTTTLCLRHSGPVGLLGFLGFLVFCLLLFFLFFLVLLTFDLLYLLLALSQILQNRPASLPACVLMAVEGDNMRLADAMSATEHLLLRELPTHVHVGRFSGEETLFFMF